MDVADFADTSPVLLPEQFFVGKLQGWAVLEGPLGGLQRRCSIMAQGERSAGDKIVRFSETWRFDDGFVDHLQWEIERVGDGQYRGREPTLDGEATGEQAGCAFHWSYTRNVPQKDGSSSKLNFDDWFFRIDESGAIVKGKAGRLGIPFAAAHVTYRRL